MTDLHNFKTFYESPNIRDSVSPSWGGIHLKLRNMCNGNLDLPIRFEVWCEIHEATDKMYGYCETTVKELRDMKKVNHKLKVPNGSGEKGMITIDNF